MAAQLHKNRKIRIPANMVPAFEAAINGKIIPAGKHVEPDGSRVYTIDVTAHPMSEINAAVDEAFKEIRDLLME